MNTWLDQGSRHGGIAIGVGVGLLFGAAMENVAAGLAIGVALGVALDVGGQTRSEPPEDDAPSSSHMRAG